MTEYSWFGLESATFTSPGRYFLKTTLRTYFAWVLLAHTWSRSGRNARNLPQRQLRSSPPLGWAQARGWQGPRISAGGTRDPFWFEGSAGEYPSCNLSPPIRCGCLKMGSGPGTWGVLTAETVVSSTQDTALRWKASSRLPTVCFGEDQGGTCKGHPKRSRGMPSIFFCRQSCMVWLDYVPV